jgi:murein L,D-transpeptidase YcbB/YkuD
VKQVLSGTRARSVPVWVLSGAVAMSAQLGLAGSAIAYDPQNAWLAAAGYTDTATSRAPNADRAFIREWEANPPKGFATLAPENLAATKAAMKRYEDIVAQGGWPVVPEVQMRVGSSEPAVVLLRQRLLASGDLKDDAANSSSFDYFVEKAVKRYQASNGLTPTGIVDKRTLAALNVPAAARLKQLKANLSRLQEYTSTAGKRYVMVNIPSAQVEAVENGRVVSRHAGVVGKTDRPTPLLRSAIHQMNFNPVWTLPPTVIEKDLIPKGRDMEARNQSVLAKYGIDAYDGNGRKLDPSKVSFAGGAARNLVYRQQPGKENPLGFLKINFHNSHSVYMHDTPSESLFGRNFRAASSGCIRVHGIEHLAAWLLADGGVTPEQIEALRKSGERKDVTLKKPVPLYFVYVTAWATEDGVVQFRRDLYNRDGLGPLAAAY